MERDAPLIIGIGGTTRDGSTSERALRIALHEAEKLGAQTRLLSRELTELPNFDPSRPERSQYATTLIESLRIADGVIISTPSYHGSISGMLKNALDYTEDLRNDERPYFDDRAVGCIVCAEGPQAMGSTLATLRSIIHALRGWPTPFAAVVNTSTRMFDTSGRCLEKSLESQLATVARQVVSFALLKRQSLLQT